MQRGAPSPDPAPASRAAAFYVTGGTLRADSPSYVERHADKDLLEGLLRAEFCYVLTSRQMGKSSLMVRTAQKLRARGVNVCVLDLTAIGQNLTPEQWYDGMILRLGRQLDLEDELEEFWRGHSRLGPVQRLLAAIHDVALARRPGPLVIFVDEIDSVRSLKFSTDEFFAAIRESHNRRAQDPELNRLTFCLLGVATPSDLIRDTRTTPFNIGHRIELTDFTAVEAAPLARGLRYGMDAVEDMEEAEARAMLARILYWTGGHPYLTQRLCRAVADRNDSVTDRAEKLRDPRAVDELCAELFLCQRAQEKDDNLIFVRERLLRNGEQDLAALLDLYMKIHGGERVPDDEGSKLVSILRLSGIARAGKYLEVRNRIYRQVFDGRWVELNTPEAEKLRQRRAFRRGMTRGLIFASIFLTLSAGGSWLAKKRLEVRHARRAVHRLGGIYHRLRTYRDMCNITHDFTMQGASMTTSGTATIVVQKPDKLYLRVSTHAGVAEFSLQFYQVGRRIWIYSPRLRQYSTFEGTNSLADTLRLASQMTGTMFDQTAYQFVTSKNSEVALEQATRSVEYLGREEMNGIESHALRWETPVVLPSAGRPGNGPRTTNMAPVTAWVGDADGIVNRLQVNFSGIIKSLSMPGAMGGVPMAVPVQRFLTTSRHAAVQINTEIAPETFVFTPPPDAQQVNQLDSAQLWLPPRATDPAAKIDRARLSELIPARDTQAPPTLVDLTPYYTTSLSDTWHIGGEGNDLAAVPRGRQRFGGVEFDTRGVVQLAGTAESYLTVAFPAQVTGISVGRRAARLRFLHGATGTATDGVQIGRYVIHYANGSQRAASILYGYDTRHWRPQPGEQGEDNGLRLAWSGPDGAARLYEMVWINPQPDVVIEKIDFCSSMTQAAPFLIAITLEP